MSARSERDRLTRELEAARGRIADLEQEIVRRGRHALTSVMSIESFRVHLGEESSAPAVMIGQAHSCCWRSTGWPTSTAGGFGAPTA